MRLPDPAAVRISGPWRHRDISANGIRLHVAEAGSGPLVLLLHGFPEFWWSWRHQLVALAEAGMRAVAVDLRGYGDSDKPPRGYDGWTLAGDVAGLIRALGEPNASLVGHGWGGLIAWTVAALHPRLVRSIVPVSAAHPLALRGALPHGRRAGFGGRLLGAQLPMLPERRLTRDGAAMVERLMHDWSGPQWTVTAEFAEVVGQSRQAMLVPGVAHCALEYFRWAVRSQFRGDGRRFAEAVHEPVDRPVLQLHGAADPCMPESAAAASRRWAGAGSRYEVLPDIGHFAPQEAPAEVNRLLIDFLSPRPGTPSPGAT